MPQHYNYNINAFIRGFDQREVQRVIIRRKTRPVNAAILGNVALNLNALVNG